MNPLRCRALARHLDSRRPHTETVQPESHELSPFSPAEDLELARSAGARDPSAVDRLIDRLGCLPVLMRARHARMGSPLSYDEFDDALQEALIAIWSKLDEYDGRVRIEVWAYGFGVIQLHRVVERRRRRRFEFLGDDDERSIPAREESELEEPAAWAKAERVLAADDLEILRLKHFEDLTFEEIGARIGLGTSTVKTRYYRGLARLRQGRMGEEA